MTLRTIRNAAAACALFSVALASEARADLNLHSSTTVECVGPVGDACSVLRFTLYIPDPQIPINATGNALPGVNYAGFTVSQFGLQAVNSPGWTFGTIANASPGTWDYESNTGTIALLGSETPFPTAPITFDINMATYGADLSTLTLAYTAGGRVTGPSTFGSDIEHQWSAGGDVTSTVPEPASMLLLGSGLMGLAGIARRRRRTT